MMKKKVYNLQFPSSCHELKIFGYRFTRVKKYGERVNQLQQLVNVYSDLSYKMNTGGHSVTSYVNLPKIEKKPVLEWSGQNITALQDILLLLSIFLGRDIFLDTSENYKDNEYVILADPRVDNYGGVLRCSIPYEKKKLNPTVSRYTFHEIGFEKGINKIYNLIREKEWLVKYQKGYFLFLAKEAFRRQSLESSFIQCWTIWEHLFAILNRKWMSKEQIRQISSVEKISFIIVQYTLRGEIDKESRNRIKLLSEIRNRLIHYGRFPERDKVQEHADLFIRLTEFVIAKIFQLSPSNLFNTVEKLEEFLNNINT